MVPGALIFVTFAAVAVRETCFAGGGADVLSAAMDHAQTIRTSPTTKNSLISEPPLPVSVGRLKDDQKIDRSHALLKAEANRRLLTFNNKRIKQAICIPAYEKK
jgi:hypothetical protein